METSKIEEQVLNRCKERGWSLTPDKDLRSLMEELGELAREVRRFEDGRERPDEIEYDPEAIKRDMASEIGDVLFPLVKIAHYYSFTLEEAFELHVEKMEKRYEKEKM